MIKSILGFGALAAVYATPITFTDTVNPSPDATVASGSTYSFTHSIVDNGFNKNTDLISSAKIDIKLKDDDQDFLFFNLEIGQIALDGVNQTSVFEVDSDKYSFNVQTTYLQNDGMLIVALKSINGDFIFQESRLEVSADRTVAPVAAVPEPGSMALMGLGMLGLGFAARRKIKA